MFFEWKSGDYTYLHLQPAFYVLRWSGEPGKAIADKIDLPFVDDPAIVGRWKTVDFVGAARDFSPGSRQWKDELFLKEMTFLPGGKSEGPWSWSKGVIMHPGDKTASRYEIREINGAKYMFFEWKSGDYTTRHIRPYLYVLRWSDNAPTTQATQPEAPRK
jgi:bla regulator protein blaR1